jgi:pimeloyl-ACP methyl ester carboxylesterase
MDWIPAAVEISLRDEPTVRGHRYGQGHRWAVLVHDEGRDLDSWQGLIPELVRAGLCVLAFDLCGHGASDDPWDPGRVVADVIRALDFAQSQGATQLYLLGAGIGGTAALAAAGTHATRAIVTLSPRAHLTGGIDAGIRASRAPKLIIAGSRDKLAAQQAAAVNQRVIGWSILETPPVEEQGTDLLWSDWGDEIRGHILAFLRDYS